MAMATMMRASSCVVGAALPSLRHYPAQKTTTVAGAPTLALPRQTSVTRAFSSPSSSFFSGCVLAPRLNVGWLITKRPSVVKVRAGKVALGCTKRSKSRKSRARTSGFRVRLHTPAGRNILKRRRAKGRKVLCPASNPSSGKLA